MTIASDRATALGATTNDLGQAGIIFNDAVRLSNGGLWSQPADDNNQQNYASQYEADISILKADIASAIANGVTVDGLAVTPFPTSATITRKDRPQLTLTSSRIRAKRISFSSHCDCKSTLPGR